MSKFNTGSDLDLEKIENGYTVVNARIGIQGPDHNWARRAVGAEPVQRGLSTRSRSTLRSRASGTQRGVEQGFYTRSTQLFGAFLAEPRTFGATLRYKWSPAPAAVPYVAPPPPPPPPPPATQTCPDGSVILATDVCPAPPPPPPPPPPAPERG